MRPGRLIGSLAERQGYRLYKKASMPWGVDHIVDIQRLSQALSHPVRTIFDVGANVGQEARAMLRHFPEAKVQSFEPHPETFKRLTAQIRSSRFQAHNCALGARSGEEELFQYEGESVINSMVTDAPFAVRFERQGVPIKVTVDTIDQFCLNHSVQTIDLIKIDTEGSDLAVLEGAANMLGLGGIKFIYVEFNDVMSAQSTGTTLQGLQETLGPCSYQFVAAYTDYLVTEGNLFGVRNALYVHQP